MDLKLSKLIETSKKHLETIFDSITDPIVIIGLDKKVQRLNNAALTLFEIKSFKDVIGSDCRKALHNCEKDCNFCIQNKIIEKKEKHTVHYERVADGTLKIYEVRFFPLLTKDKEIESIVEHYVDITSGELAKRDLQKAYATIMDELEVASSVQESILPKKLPAAKELRFSIHYQPASNVGGDFYDLFEMEDGKIGLLIADVSGHGIPAAFIAAMTQMSLYLHIPELINARELLKKINTDLFNKLRMDHFVSAFLLIFDPLHNSIQYSRAGHPAVILIKKNGEIRKLTTKGFFLGIMKDGGYIQHEVELEKGDRLFLYTDGITELDGVSGKSGVDRFINILKSSRNFDLDDVSKLIQAEIEDFSITDKLNDDLTYLLIECTKDSCQKTFKFEEDFDGAKSIILKRAKHPLDFNDIIAEILKKMDNYEFPDNLIRKCKFVLYEIFDLFNKTKTSNTTEIIAAYRVTPDQLIFSLTDNRFTSDENCMDIYSANPEYQGILDSIEDFMDDTIFAYDGRKIVIKKKNPSVIN